jgi:integrase
VAGDRNLIKDAFEYQVKKGIKIRDFTMPEAVRLLLSARLQINSVLRWAPWIMAYTGCRIAELLRSRASAIQSRDGIWVIALQEGNTAHEPSTRMHDERLKTDESERVVPLRKR